MDNLATPPTQISAQAKAEVDGSAARDRDGEAARVAARLDRLEERAREELRARPRWVRKFGLLF